MSTITLEQVIELAFKLTAAEQTLLLARVAAHLANRVEATNASVIAESLSGRTLEIWSPQDEGGVIAAMNQVLAEYKNQKRAQNAG